MPEGANVEQVRARFGATADRVAEHAEQKIETVREQLRSFLFPSGDERALDVGTGAGTLALALAPLVREVVGVDVGTGAGTLALALAPLVREVVGVDVVPELLERARARAPANVTFVEGDATSLPFEAGSFDLACTRRTLHHIARPELVVAQLAR